jgi:hypothetical protein
MSMRRAWHSLQRFWHHDPGLSVILGVLVLLVFVLPPFTGPREERGPVMDVMFTLLLLAGVTSLQARAVVRALLFLAALAATVVRFWSHPPDSALALAALVALALMTVVVLAQTFRAGPVSVHRIQGAIAGYLLLGLVWAAAYDLVAAFVPGAFVTGQGRAPDDQDLLYFSFVTLTTVGYGDVTPVSPAARSLALAEALAGQLYPAILLARLVALYAQPDGKDR